MVDFDDYTIGDHRAACPVCSKTQRDKSLGITILAYDHGIARCFKCNFIQLRREQRELSPVEKLAYQRRMEALRRQHDAEQRQRHAEVAQAADVRWKAAVPADTHPYLSAKGIQSHGARVEAGHTLLVRMTDVQGHIHNAQSIAPDGVKRFMAGGRVKGLYYPIGRPSGRLVVCEGFATGATIHEDTGHAIAVAFNAGNLLAVAKSLRTKFPCITLVIAADDDWKTEGNPGVTAATEAARAVGGLLAVPNFAGLDRGEKDTDFNDLHRLTGSVEVPA